MSVTRTSSVHPLTTHPVCLIPTITSSFIIIPVTVMAPCSDKLLSLSLMSQDTCQSKPDTLPLAQIADHCTNAQTCSWVCTSSSHNWSCVIELMPNTHLSEFSSV